MRSNYNDTLRPDVFDVGEANEAVKEVAAEPVPVVEELASLLQLTRNSGANGLRATLAHPSTFGTTEVSAEDAAILTWPVAQLRLTAQALGLVSVRKGRIAPTRAAAKCADDPQAILRHITGRLPIGRTPSDRQAGWMALAVVASETPAELWKESISELLFDLDWRDTQDPYRLPSAESPTLDALNLLAGAMRTGWRHEGVYTAAAAVARSVIRA